MKTTKILISLCLTILLSIGSTQAQVSIGTTNTPTSGSVLDLSQVDAKNLGLMLPKVALTNSITWSLAGTKIEGMFVYNTATSATDKNIAPGVYYWKNNQWNALADVSSIPAEYEPPTCHDDFGNIVSCCTDENGNTIPCPVIPVTGFWSMNGNKGTSGSNFIGTIDNQDLIFRTNNKESMRLSKDGNLGIGTMPTGAKVSINGGILSKTFNNNDPWSASNLYLQKARGSQGAIQNLQYGDQVGGIYFGAQVAGKIESVATISSNYYGDGTLIKGSLNFRTSNQSRLYITENGNIGIGTVNPNSLLTANGVITTRYFNVGTSSGANIYIQRARGTEGDMSNLQSGDAIGGIYWDAHFDGKLNRIGRIASYYVGDGTTIKSRMYFDTSNTTQMAINENGNVGIGTMSPSYKLHVNGTAAGTSAWQIASDSRYKKNISTIQNPLSIIQKLRGTTYEYKKSDFPEIAFKDGKQYGVIAQEVEKIMPEIVSTDAEGYKSVAYTDIIPVLIESIKAQQAMIEQLKLEVESLKKAQ